MLMLAWFWVSMFAALMPTPAQIISLPGQMLDAQRAAEAERSLMALGWIEGNESPIF